MKPIKCELWIGTSCRFFKWGEFKSVTAAKQYVKDCITCYHKIIKIKP